MKRKLIIGTIVLVLITGGLTVASFARGGRHGWHAGWGHGPGGFGPRAEMMVEKLADELDLSQTQRNQAFAVLDQARPAMRQARFAIADQRRALRRLNPADADYQTHLKEIADEVGKLAGQMVMLHGELHANLNALLTEEQRQQLQTLRLEHRGHRFWDAP
jgi:protein CpxP